MPYHKILHIDDDEDDQEIFLTALGHITQEVEYTALDSAVEALQQLSNSKMTADLIFLDLNMPQMNGQQFLIELKKHEHLKQIPVIVLSTSAHAPTIELVKELGAHDFITKPDNFNEFIHTLRNILS